MLRMVGPAMFIALVGLIGCGVNIATDGSPCRGKCERDSMDPLEPPPDPDPLVLRCHPKGYYREFTTFNAFILWGASRPSPQVFDLQVHFEEQVTLVWELSVVEPYRGVDAYDANAEIVVLQAGTTDEAAPEEIASEVLDKIPVNKRAVPISADAEIELTFDAKPGSYEVMLFADPTDPRVDDILASTNSKLAAKCTPGD